MQAAVPEGMGAMCVLLGADIAKATALAEAASKGSAAGNAAEICAVANDNDPGQVVLSGHTSAIERAVAVVKDFGIKRAMMLKVSAPFHCSLMQPAADAMAQALTETPPGALRVALLANITAALVTDPAQAQRLLVEQVTGRVRWRESMIALNDAGTQHFVELGANVLGPMITRTVTDAAVTSVTSMTDIEALLREI